jgi:uncharacterized protein (TIGR00255 family)
MTGAGTASVDEPGIGRFEAEARSVNHRFLKTTVRAYGPLPTLDTTVEEHVRRTVERGHVTVTVRFTPEAATAASRLDEEALGAVAQRLRDAAQRAGLPGPTLGDVLSVPGVLHEPRAEGDEERVVATALRCVDAALRSLRTSRENEGARLVAELRTLLDAIAAGAAEIARRAPEIPVALKARLEARLGELLADSALAPDPAVLAREAAMLADRADVREETARLEAHVDHVRVLLVEGGPVGRRLDFLVQELHRESNTVSSKSADLETTRTAIDLKTHVERLREQVQNIE